MFDRATHMQELSKSPRRIEAVRQRLTVRWTPAMDAKLVEMASERRSVREICAAVGVGKELVRKRRNAMGLPKSKASGPKPRMIKI